MKFFAALIGTISLLPLPAIAAPDPIGLPMCYMISSRGVLLNLNYLCGAGTTTASRITSNYGSTFTNTSYSNSRDSVSSSNTSSKQCKAGTIDRDGNGLVCTVPCPTGFYFDRPSLSCVMPQQEPTVTTPFSSNGYSGNSNSGNCNYPEDRAADGSRCGARAKYQ